MSYRIKQLFNYLGFPPPLWTTNSPTRIYEYKRIFEGVKVSENEKALDFGCGAGIFTFKLARLFNHVIGIDKNETMIKQANRYKRRFLRKSHIEFMPGRIEELEFPAGYYNKIFCVCVLQLVENLPTVLGEMYRVLSSGGEIRMTVDSFDYVTDQAVKENYRKRHQIFEYFTEESISRYLHNAGFKIETIEPILTGKTAKSHFQDYLIGKQTTYSLLTRYKMYRKIILEDQACQDADKQGAELFVIAKK